jgi:DNA-binding SARP family transcriptional activator/tetratricopeptide (TPR) repeat protein
MEFRILGPLEVFDEGRSVDVGAAKQRALLAVLLLNANRVVSSDRLIEALWGERAPGTAPKALQVYVSQLRKALGRDRILTRAPGYELRVDAGELDLDRFQALDSEGHLDEALRLWRGSPLAEFVYEPFAQSEIGRLEELRLACLERRIEEDLATGRHAAIIGELERLVSLHPLRERLRAELMLALYRSGRQAEALDAYQDARRALTEELGIVPSQGLRELEQAILRQDAALELDLAVAAETRTGAFFVGREEELEALRTDIDEASRGHGRLVLLVGEPGIGKSRLAEEALRIAHQRSARVLVGRCWEAGGAPAYWPWVQALRSYLHDCDRDLLRTQLAVGAEDVAHLLPELRELFPDLPDPSSPESEGARIRLFEAVLAFLKNIARERPLVMFFDDLHAADEPSLLLLRFLARDIAGARLFLLAAYRDVDPMVRDPLRTNLSELLREPVTRRISLDGLARHDVAEYITIAASLEPEANAVAEIHAETAGNPLFVGEIVRLLVAQARLGAGLDTLEIPAGIREVIGSRVARLTEPSRKLLTLASVLGREFEIDALRHLSGYSDETLYDALDEAMSERIIGDVPGDTARLRFEHVLIRDTLYDELTPVRRMQQHREAGAVLERIHASHLDPHLAEIALHLVAAGPESTGRAVEFARLAADLAATSLAFEEAVRLYELALTLAVDDVSRCDLLLALGDALARAGDTPASKRRFAEAAQLAEKRGLAEQLAHAALGYGGRIVWEVSRDDDRLIPLLERALEALPPEDGPLRVRLLARLAGPLRDARFPAERRHAIADEALAMARRLEDPPTLAYALAGYLPAHMSPARTHRLIALGTELINLAIDTGELERAVEGYLCRACPLLELGEIDRATEDVVALARLAEELRQPSQLLYAANLRAHLALLAGKFQEAEQLIEEAIELGDRAQSWNARIAYRMQLYLLRKAQGRLEELVNIYEGHRGAFDYRTYPIFDCILARFYDDLGRHDEARARFEELAENDFGGVPVDEEWLASMCLLAEAAASLGDLRRSRVLYELLRPYEDRVGTSYPEINLGSVARYLGLLSATEARWGEAERHFTDALHVNRRIGARPWLGHTQEDYARMLFARGEGPDAEKAGQLLDDARTTYRALGMTGPLATLDASVV